MASVPPTTATTAEATRGTTDSPELTTTPIKTSAQQITASTRASLFFGKSASSSVGAHEHTHNSLSTDSQSQRLAIRVVVLDCDGVLWRGSSPIAGAAQSVEVLRDKLGLRVMFVSNNSTLSRAQYVEKFEKLGFTGVRPEDIVSTSAAAALWLQLRLQAQQEQQQGETAVAVADAATNVSPKVFVCGEDGLSDELRLAGFEVVPAPPASLTPAELEVMEVDRDIAAVVCGMDRTTSYAKMTYAHLCLTQNPSCLFVATNLDSTFPVAKGRFLPGGGATMAGLITSTGRKPEVVGKPGTFMLEHMVLRAHHHIAPPHLAQEPLQPEQALMVGDRLDTDIAFGRSGGLQTCLVLTGVSQLVDLEAVPEHLHPHWWADSLVALVDGL